MIDKNLKFDITPHVVRQLGEQLITDEITALLELIKNSYDADATYVSIEVNTRTSYSADKLINASTNGYLVVEDDGFGMDLNTIIDSWLVISFSKKRSSAATNRKSKTPDGRTPLGEKGLGRLSTQRLARYCEILTKKKGEDGVHVAFDWNEFDKVSKLSEVKVKSKVYSPSRDYGTKLVLADLVYPDIWEGEKLVTFLGKVSQIISPFEENRPFEVYLSVNGREFSIDSYNKDLKEMAISSFDIVYSENKILSISGETKLKKFLGNKKDEFAKYLEPDNGDKFIKYLQEVDQSLNVESSNMGNFISFKKSYDILKDIGGLEFTNQLKEGEEEKAFANPMSFNGSIQEFSFKKSEDWGERKIESFDRFSEYKEFVKKQIGIKLYRNGFAVKPYGIDGEDWLKLRESQTGGGFYRLRPANVVGYFAIDEGINIHLKDKTDREGLLENPFSSNFMILIYFCRDEINRYQERIRRHYDEFIKLNIQENTGISTIQDAFNVMKSTVQGSHSISKELSSSISEIDSLSIEINSISSNTSEELFSIRPEMKHKLIELEKRLAQISASLSKYLNLISKLERLNDVINTIEPQLALLEDQLVQFSELASIGVSAESINHEFSNLSLRLMEKVNYYKDYLRKNETISTSEVSVLLEYIKSISNSLMMQLKHFDSSLKYKREYIKSFTFSEYFNSENKYYQNRLNSSNIEFHVEIVDDFSVTGNQGKITQTFDNLISNSEYWLNNRAKADPEFVGKILIKVNTPWITLEDNGFGVSKEVENNIFEPFVTTKPANHGRGLGLFIVQQLLDSMSCSISILPKRNEHDRRYIFMINLSSILTK